jgi:hypothetical protein
MKQENGEEEALLAALLAMHRRRQARARPRKGSTYARLLDYFERRGQRLRGERLATSELLERLVPQGPPLRRIQQELALVGAPGTQAAGRFRVTNRSAAPARFDLVVGEPLEGEARPDVRFEPRHGCLEPGESSLVRVEASLAGLSAGQRITLPLECRWRTGFDRLWLILGAEAER